ncbi:KH domain-containing protein, partial [Pantoea sp. SIMBA_072]
AKRDYANLLHQDLKLRGYLQGRLQQAGCSRVVIERPAKKARVTIHSARPGVVIGKKGEKLKQISTEARMDMERLFDGPVYLETFVKVKSGWADNEAGLRA